MRTVSLDELESITGGDDFGGGDFGGGGDYGGGGGDYGGGGGDYGGGGGDYGGGGDTSRGGGGDYGSGGGDYGGGDAGGGGYDSNAGGGYDSSAGGSYDNNAGGSYDNSAGGGYDSNAGGGYDVMGNSTGFGGDLGGAASPGHGDTGGWGNLVAQAPTGYNAMGDFAYEQAPQATNVQTFDDGSRLVTFDNGSTSATPAVEPTTGPQPTGYNAMGDFAYEHAPQATNVQTFDDGSRLVTFDNGSTSASPAIEPYTGPQPTGHNAMGDFAYEQAPQVSHVQTFDDGSRLVTYDNGTTSATGPIATAPDRGWYPAGAEGTQQYLQDFHQYNLERLSTGQNTVGPNGSEQNAIFEALGSGPGAQQFGADHDMQATYAALQAQAGGGWANYDLMNQYTAVSGWANTAVTAPFINAYNYVTGSNVNPAAWGATVTQLQWALGGYVVPGSRGGQ